MSPQALTEVLVSIFRQNWPIGPWAKGKKNKEIGYWFAEDVQDGVRNAEALFTRMLGWSSQEFAVAAANVNNEIKGRKKHMWFEMYVPLFPSYPTTMLEVESGNGRMLISEPYWTLMQVLRLRPKASRSLSHAVVLFHSHVLDLITQNVRRTKDAQRYRPSVRF